jgi:hypothetical protein
VSKQRGSTVTVHSLIEATALSDPVDLRGFNAILIEIAVTVAAKNWTVSVHGSNAIAGTYAALSVNGAAVSKQTSGTWTEIWTNMPDWIKVNANEDEDGGKCTVKVTPVLV